MIASICMTERMKCVISSTKVFTGNKHSSGCSKRNITLTVTNCTCSYSSCRIVTCTCNNFYILTESKFFRNLRFQSSYYFPTLIQFRKLLFCDSTDLSSISFDQQRFFTSRRSIPEAIRNICTKRTGQTICQIILGSIIFTTFLKFSGSFFCIQRIFGAVKPAKAIFAVYCESLSFPITVFRYSVFRLYVRHSRGLQDGSHYHPCQVLPDYASGRQNQSRYLIFCRYPFVSSFIPSIISSKPVFRFLLRPARMWEE